MYTICTAERVAVKEEYGASDGTRGSDSDSAAECILPVSRMIGGRVRRVRGIGRHVKTKKANDNDNDRAERRVLCEG